MFLVGFLFVLLSLQGCFSAYVEVTPREAVVLPKESFNFLCKIGEAIQYCRIQINGIPSALNLSPLSQPTRGISYFGEGLESGQCGATIESIKEIHNGLINCSMGTATSSSESLASARLIVAKAPKAPELELNGGNDKLSEYKTGDQLYASCVVRDGRPAANISWYLDDVLITEKAIIPTIIDVAREDLYTTVQNISWRLQVSDHGKVLKCVAHHPTRYLNNQNSQVLKIIFAPQKNTDMMQQFGYKIGEPGEIRVDINANPKPKIEWTIGDQRIKEDMVDESGRYKAERLTDEGLGHYTARLTIAQISKEDTENTFHLTAYNDQGHAEYSVVISTNPEPQGIQIGYLAIIVVVVLLFILIVSLLIFARVTGRWCFSGGATIIDYTTGAEIGPNQPGQDGVDNPHHNSSQDYINGNDNQIKKKDEKIDTAV